MDIAGARPADAGFITGHPEQRHAADPGAERKGPAVIFQQHNPLPGGLARHFRMRGEIRPVRIGVTMETGRPDDELQHTGDAEVEEGVGEFAPIHFPDQFLDLAVHAGLHQVVARGHLAVGLALAGPVGHHEPVEAPFAPEHVRQEPGVALGVLAVDFVVGGHDRPGRGLADRDLEAPQVQLPQGAHVDPRIIAAAVGFLAVGGVVLGGGPDPVGLDATDHRRGHLPAEDGVLGIILEVPAVERVTMDVQSRGKQDVHPVFEGFIAHRDADLPDRFLVPGAGEDGPGREGRGVKLPAFLPLADRFDPDAGRPVREDDFGDTQPRDGPRLPRRARHEHILAPGQARPHALEAGADDEIRLFFEGQGGDDLRDVVLPQAQWGILRPYRYSLRAADKSQQQRNQ